MAFWGMLLPTTRRIGRLPSLGLSSTKWAPLPSLVLRVKAQSAPALVITSPIAKSLG